MVHVTSPVGERCRGTFSIFKREPDLPRARATHKKDRMAASTLGLGVFGVEETDTDGGDGGVFMGSIDTFHHVARRT